MLFSSVYMNQIKKISSIFFYKTKKIFSKKYILNKGILTNIYKPFTAFHTITTT